MAGRVERIGRNIENREGYRQKEGYREKGVGGGQEWYREQRGNRGQEE